MKNAPSYGNNISNLDKSGTDIIVCPAFVDVHVHLREPGFSYKETILTGSRAAAAGGYTCVCAMPNLNPAPDSVENLDKEIDMIRRDAVIDVLPYATITKGRKGLEVVDVEALKDRCVAFSDDGSGVQDSAVMRSAMERIAAAGGILAAHCEDNSLLHGGYIHDGVYAREHGHKGICSESEWGQIERDLKLAEETGCPYHVCHISTKESVQLIREAKSRGVDVSCETGPHYLVLTDEDLMEEGRFKMNPPLRGKEDRDALIEGIKDGTIDMIATDHAPHSAGEKSKGLAGSAFGIVGLETAFPVLYSELVLKGIINLDRLFELMSYAPRKRFRLGEAPDDRTVFEVATPYRIDSGSFLSMGHSTPFDGWEVRGRCLETVHNGKTIYKKLY